MSDRAIGLLRLNSLACQPPQERQLGRQQTKLCRLVRQYTQTKAATGASLPQFVKNAFDGFLRPRCSDCDHGAAGAAAQDRRSLMKLLTRRGVLVEWQGSSYLARSDADSDDARTLRAPQASASPGSALSRSGPSVCAVGCHPPCVS